MYQIVVPVDNDVSRAVAQAQYVANLPGKMEDISVTVAHAYDDRNSSSGDRLPDEESSGVTKAVNHLSETGVSVATRELYDPVAESITDLATELNADKIVISGRKRSPTGKALFGSVTQSVILNSEIPVTVVPAE